MYCIKDLFHHPIPQAISFFVLSHEKSGKLKTKTKTNKDACAALKYTHTHTHKDGKKFLRGSYYEAGSFRKEKHNL